ncbi:hypothetical protein D3C87_1191400 [compost metagenome]
MLRGLRQVHGGGLGFLYGGGDLSGSEVDRGDQITQLVHGIVDRVGDGAGEVLSHRSGHGQVAVGQVLDLIEQPHDRVLVAFVLLGGFPQLPIGFTHHHQADEDDRHQCRQAQYITADGVGVASAGQVFKAASQVRGLVEQGLRQAENVGGRLAHLEQLR